MKVLFRFHNNIIIIENISNLGLNLFLLRESAAKLRNALKQTKIKYECKLKLSNDQLEFCCI